MPPKTKAAAKTTPTADRVADTNLPPDDNTPGQDPQPGDHPADHPADTPEASEQPDELSNEDTVGQETVGTPQAPAPDESGPAETQDDGLDGLERGFAHVPCQVCFPDGWPVEEEGAYVNCAHDFGVRFGEPVEITRERAVELGFLDGRPVTD